MASGIVLFILSGIFQTQTNATEPVTLLSIVFEGNKAVDSGVLQSRLRHSRPGGVYEPAILQFELRAISRFYEDEGFLKAAIGQPSVDISESPGNGKAAAVRIPVFEGPQYVLSRLEVRNAVALDPATLQQMCPIKSGQPYGRSKVQAWVDKIMSAYHELGYLRAETRLQEDVDDLKHTVGCLLECSEGVIYNVRRLNVVGLQNAEAQDFRRRLLVGEGMVYNPEMLVLSLQLLNSLGTYRPMSGGSVKVTIDDAAKSVDLEFSPVLVRKPGQSPQN